MNDHLRLRSKYTATMELRFIKRPSKNFPGETGYKYILQQRWKNPVTGDVKWIDVPRYDPEEQDADA